MFLTCSHNTDSTSKEGPETEVSFSFPSFDSRQSPRATGELTPNEIICVNLALNADEPRFERKVLETENSVTLLKNDIYLLGFTYNPVLSGETAPSTSRSISDAITTVGNWKDATTGLDSLPLNEEAENEVTLGEVTQDENGTSSSLEEEYISEATGYSNERLEYLTSFDNTVKKFLNPDINMNGTYDFEEDFYWAMQIYYSFDNTLSITDFKNDNFTALNEQQNFGHFQTIFRIEYSGFTDDYFELDLPDSASTDKIPSSENGTSVDGDHNFLFPNDGAAPYAGDYILLRDDEPFLYFQDLDFFSPINNLEGLIVMVGTTTQLQNGNVEMNWKWKVIRNGELSDIPEEEVRTYIKFIYIKAFNGDEEFVVNHEQNYFSSEDGDLEASYWFADSVEYSPDAHPNYDPSRIIFVVGDLADNRYEYFYTTP